MSGERYYYYIKLINSPTENDIGYYMDISQQLENDNMLNEDERYDLEMLIDNYITTRKKMHVKVINAVTGIEEEPPKTIYDDFGGNAVFLGMESRFGVEWKVYEPKNDFNLLFKKWYYNEYISRKLNITLKQAVPGKISNYFDIPPWIFGTDSYKGVQYVPLKSILETAVAMELIPNKYYLTTKGIPKAFIDHLKEDDMWI